MRHHDEPERGAAQERLQPLDRLQVQVVGRLVEGQEPGTAREAAREGCLAQHAARERVHGRVLVGQPQLPAERGEAVEDPRILRGGFAVLRARRPAVEAELPQRRSGGERGVLLEAAHRELPVARDRPGVGGEDAVEDLQEGGFARPVLPDEADPLPVVDAEGHRLEQGGIQQGLAHAVERQDVHA